MARRQSKPQSEPGTCRAPDLWTIGHSTLPIEQFIASLETNRIEVIADVRRFPGSRRHPQFGQEELSASLKKAGIEYVHFPELGGRRPSQKNSPNTAWRNEAFRGYADYMMSSTFQNGIQRLQAIAEKKRTAVLCAEALWWRCHRGLIADYFKAHGAKVLHILSSAKVEEHPFTGAARLVDGKLSYSLPETEPTFAF